MEHQLERLSRHLLQDHVYTCHMASTQLAHTKGGPCIGSQACVRMNFIMAAPHAQEASGQGKCMPHRNPQFLLADLSHHSPLSLSLCIPLTLASGSSSPLPHEPCSPKPGGFPGRPSPSGSPRPRQAEGGSGKLSERPGAHTQVLTKPSSCQDPVPSPLSSFCQAPVGRIE